LIPPPGLSYTMSDTRTKIKRCLADRKNANIPWSSLRYKLTSLWRCAWQR
jgi:hypothetical protein